MMTITFNLRHLCCCFYFFAALCTTLQAQNKQPNIVFGEASRKELEMKYCPLDSSAEAMLLYEKCDITFNIEYNQPMMEKHYQARYKIFKRSGKDRGIITLPYYESSKGKELIGRIQGFTYNLDNGTIVTSTLSTESVFEEKLAEGAYRVTITLPNIKEGTVLEYRYSQRTPFSVRNDPMPFYFQGNVPHQYSELNIQVPHFFQYRMILGGYLDMSEHSKKESTARFENELVRAEDYHFVMKDAPAFHDEPYTTSRKDYISRMEFELARVDLPGWVPHDFCGTWADVHSYLKSSERFGQELNNTDFLDDIAPAFQSLKDSMTKINAAFEYMSSNMSWNHHHGIYTSERLKTAFGNKTGSATEINLLLVSLLRKAGLDANPVVMSTRGNGEVREQFPSLDRFNYTIAQVRIKGKDVLLDATEPLGGQGLLPERCHSQWGLIIQKDDARLIPLTTDAKYTTIESLDAELDVGAAQLKGTVSLSYASQAALEKRSSLAGIGEEQFVSNIKKNWPDAQSLELENKDRSSQAFKVSLNFTKALNSSSSTSTFLLNPIIWPYGHDPFKESHRIYPVDFVWPYQHTYIASIKIPQGYEVSSLPKGVTISLPEKAGKYTYVVESDGGYLRIRCQLSVNKSYFWPSEYKGLDEFFTRMAQKQSEYITLKKTTP